MFMVCGKLLVFHLTTVKRDSFDKGHQYPTVLACGIGKGDCPKAKGKGNITAHCWRYKE